tara:strand:- start:23 stop:826 length:804 start_codon:yes stop_codon:yes gene_type:complete
MDNIFTGVTGMLPSEYRLYLESMMPSMNEVPIGDDYFNDKMKNQMKDAVLSKIINFDADSEGLIDEFDYSTRNNPRGTNDPDSLTGFNQLFNTLGSYNYEIVPNSQEQGGGILKIIDRYDWNPNYNNQGYVSSGGIDVTTPMLLSQLYRQFNPRQRDMANTLEMIGNRFGHKESKGEGRDVSIDIPISSQEILNAGFPQSKTTNEAEVDYGGTNRPYDSKGSYGGGEDFGSPFKSKPSGPAGGMSYQSFINRAQGGLVSINTLTEKI